MIKDKEVRDNSLGVGRLKSLVMGRTRGSNRKGETEALPITNHRRMPRPGAKGKSQHYRKSLGCALVSSAQRRVPR